MCKFQTDHQAKAVSCNILQVHCRLSKCVGSDWFMLAHAGSMFQFGNHIQSRLCNTRSDGVNDYDKETNSDYAKMGSTSPVAIFKHSE